jgi:hypothetical protein
MTGFGTVVANSPALVQNTGYEITAAAKIIDAARFSWSVNFNISINRNKLLAYPDISRSPFANSLVIGKPLNLIHLVHYTGVDPQTGQYSFEDRNHDGTIISEAPNRPYDDMFIYDLSPKYFGGLGTNFSFKGLQLVLYFNFKKQIGKNAYNSLSIPGIVGNQSAEILGKQWQKPGDQALYAKFTTQPGFSGYFLTGSDGVYTDASYIRLSNLSLSYNLPESYLKKLGLQACSFFLNANNLFTITKYKGADPETQSFKSLPPTRTITGGLSFTF